MSWPDLLLVAAAVFLAVAVGLLLAAPAGLIAAALEFVGLWWLFGEADQ